MTIKDIVKIVPAERNKSDKIVEITHKECIEYVHKIFGIVWVVTTLFCTTWLYRGCVSNSHVDIIMGIVFGFITCALYRVYSRSTNDFQVLRGYTLGILTMFLISSVVIISIAASGEVPMKNIEHVAQYIAMVWW